MEAQPQPYETLILVCTNVKEEGKACCGGRGSQELFDALKAAVALAGLKGRVRVSRTGCLDQCAFGPNIMVFPDAVWYSQVTVRDIPTLIERHVARE